MAFDLRKFLDSLDAETKGEDLFPLVSKELWRQNPEEAAIKALRRTGKYDAEMYLEMYPDVLDAGADAFEHFVRHGINEKRILPLLQNGGIARPVINKKLKLKKAGEEIKEVKTDLKEEAKKEATKTREDYYDELRLPGYDLDKNKLNIGFLLGGGLGDYLIFFNYLYHFCEKYKNNNVTIDTIYDPNKKIADLFLKKNSICDNIYNHPKTTSYFKNYDLFIQLNRYPEIKFKNFDKIKLFNPKLLDYILQCEKFKITYPRYFSGYMLDGQSAALCELFGIKRIQQPDIFGTFGITEEYKYKLPMDQDCMRYIHSFGLQKNEYITLHRGCDTRYPKNSTKLWPLDYYNALIKMLKNAWPNKKLVQIGVSYERSGIMDNVDCNLVENTNMLQLASLLKHSALHIDNEGGLVHLRHALNTGPSIVMFGPTSDKFFGYSENCNIRGKGCDHWCEWLTDTWMIECPKKYFEPPCMLSIVPDLVMAQARKVLDSVK